MALVLNSMYYHRIETFDRSSNQDSHYATTEALGSKPRVSQRKARDEQEKLAFPPSHWLLMLTKLSLWHPLKGFSLGLLVTDRFLISSVQPSLFLICSSVSLIVV